MAKKNYPWWLHAIAVVMGAGLVAGLMCLHGMVAAQMWEWFLVPLGAPVITISQMIGIRLFIGMFRINAWKGKAIDTKRTMQSWIGTPVVVYICGWLVYTVL